MPKTTLQLINNILSLVGEQPLTSSAGNVGLLVRNAIETALVSIAQESRANVFETQLTATVTADDYLVPAYTLATSILQVYSVSVRSSYGSTFGDNLSKLEYLPLESLMNEPAYSIVGQNLYISPTVARPLTLHIIALQAPTLPASDGADCGLPDALIGFVSHAAAAIVALSYLDDPNQAAVHENLATKLGDKLKSQYGNTRAKSFNLSGQRSQHKFAGVAQLPSVFGSLDKINIGDVVWTDDVNIDVAYTTALGLANTELLFNRKTQTLYKYTGSAWAEYIPSSEFAFINKHTGTLFKYTDTWGTTAATTRVKDWGARGDNATDDSVPIQNAIDYAVDNKTDVYFDSGTYICEVVVPNNGTGISYTFPNLIGEGTSATFLSAPAGKYAINISVMDNWQKPVIRDMTFTGGSGGVRFGNPADTTNAIFSGGVRFVSCNFSNLDKAVYKPFGNIGCVFDSCSFYAANYHYFAVGVVGMHAGADTFNACHFQGATKASIYIDSNISGTGQTIFNSCIWEANAGFPIFVANYSPVWTPKLSLVSCWFEYNATDYANRQVPPIVSPTVVIEGITYTPKTAYFKNALVEVNNTMVRDWQLVNTVAHVYNTSTGEATIESYTQDNDSAIIVENLSPDPALNQSILRKLPSEKIVAGKTGTKEVLTHAKQALTHNPNAILSQSFANSVYTFTDIIGGVATVNSTQVADGILFDSCAEVVVPAGGRYFYSAFTVPTNKIIVWSGDVRNMTGNASLQVNLSFSATIPGELATNADTKWHSYKGLYSTFGVSSFAASVFLRNDAASPITVRLSAFQVLAFDTIQEALDYINHDYFSTDTPRVIYGTAIPTTGTWSRGDICYNTTPSAGGFIGWVCTSSGSPGTWRTFGVIS